MRFLAATLVNAKALPAVVKAVRAAYLAVGAVEGQGTSITIGAPRKGWCAISDSSRHTTDLGVAAALADHLKTRVIAVGLRGGKAAMKPFGPWKTKPKTSGKAKIVDDLVERLGISLPLPWELDERDSVTLSFDLRKATRAPGPFTRNTPTDLLEAEQGAQRDVVWWVGCYGLNRKYKEATLALGGLRDTWGWQHAFEKVMHSLHSNSMRLEPGSARLFVAMAKRALEGLTTKTLPARWAPSSGAGWSIIRWGVALTAALVADDLETWAVLVRAVQSDERQRIALYVWTKWPGSIATLSSTARRSLERDLPAASVLAWAKTAPLETVDRWLAEATQLAACHADDSVLDRIEPATSADEHLASAIGRAAFRLLSARQFAEALRLYDRLLGLELTDLTIFTNALYAVQADNNGLKLDRARATRYLAAAAPHAEKNPTIYLNVAAVQLELGDREAMFVALEAAKRHKLKQRLAELRDQKMFAPFRRDPRFVGIVGKRK